MKFSMLMCGLAAGILTLAHKPRPTNHSVPCENGPSSRGCWGEYSIDTDWYEEGPRTGVTREYWWVVENITMAPDGYLTQVFAINRSIPGPAIEANWGDEVVLHVTNLMPDNGTSFHFHGIRQLNNNVMDGVPGVTQCPIAPGSSFTYRWIAEQYGTTWYHSHLSLQYSVGLQGPIIIHGPTTSDYDEDLGTVFLQDWSHVSPFSLYLTARTPDATGPPSLASALVNGKNEFNCTGSNDTNCIGNGTRSEWHFEAGKRYLMRIVNTGTYSNFRFAIDGHNLTVVASDLVPIVPYTTDNVIITMGQRYDVIIEANADPDPGNYWLRAIWQTSCCPNDYANNTLGIIRYDPKSTALPTTTSPALGYPDSCVDEPAENLVPWVPLRAGAAETVDVFNLTVNPELPQPKVFMWQLNGSYLWANFSAPTNVLLASGVNASSLPTEYVAYTTPNTPDSWVYLIFNDVTYTNRRKEDHPMHMHGHDFLLIGTGDGLFNPASSQLNLNNPPRRDTATWPKLGWIAIAIRLDNPGTWLFHCHLAWHNSEGLSLQLIERRRDMVFSPDEVDAMTDVCNSWDQYWNDPSHFTYYQEDSGL